MLLSRPWFSFCPRCLLWLAKDSWLFYFWHLIQSKVLTSTLSVKCQWSVWPKTFWRKFTSQVSGMYIHWYTFWTRSPNLQFILFLPGRTLAFCDSCFQAMALPAFFACGPVQISTPHHHHHSSKRKICCWRVLLTRSMRAVHNSNSQWIIYSLDIYSKILAVLVLAFLTHVGVLWSCSSIYPCFWDSNAYPILGPGQLWDVHVSKRQFSLSFRNQSPPQNVNSALVPSKQQDSGKWNDI